MTNETETEYHKTSLESVDEMTERDELDVFYAGGWLSATVTDEDGGSTRTPAVELEAGCRRLLIKDYQKSGMMLYEWDVGVEEDFADWREVGRVQNVDRVETKETVTEDPRNTGGETV